jgi:ubiquinol-cytochrome c reductase cytochrome c subunit
MRRLVRAALAAAGLACCTLGTLALAAPGSGAQRPADPAHGRQLYVSGCSSCHGIAARGIPTRGPSLRGVGALAADFYLRTGRMPLARPDDYPIRAHSVYSQAQRADLVAYIASFGGPPIPRVNPAAGSLPLGKELFTEHCAGCHQVVGQGGVVTPNTIAPPLDEAKPIDVAEALRIGPYVMPRFNEKLIDSHQVDSLARYVQHLHNLPNDGGWGIGNIGPIPEGLVLWGLGIVALLVVARLIGERTTQ